MYPRLRIDIQWSGLARVAWQCLSPSTGHNAPLTGAANSEAVFTLSVRSAFDLLLSALNLPAGSEVLLSEVTVPHMVRIVRAHGLIPVPLPVDPRTLEVDINQLQSQTSDRTRLVVIAHLFGARASLDAVARLASERSILLVEDCAQALVNGSPERSPEADVSLYSFGPIKTATALGGGIALVRDSELRAQMNTKMSEWPRQSNFAFLTQRVMKLSFLKLLSYPFLLTPLAAVIDGLGGDADKFVGGSARGFPDGELFVQLRKQPCTPLRQLITRRLSNFNVARITQRTQRGQRLAEQTGANQVVAGIDNPSHTYWVFPLVCHDPETMVAKLRAAGFDASQISGLVVVENDDPSHWFHRTVFVPHGEQIPQRKLAAIEKVFRITAE